MGINFKTLNNYLNTRAYIFSDCPEQIPDYIVGSTQPFLNTGVKTVHYLIAPGEIVDVLAYANNNTTNKILTIGVGAAPSSSGGGIYLLSKKYGSKNAGTRPSSMADYLNASEICNSTTRIALNTNGGTLITSDPIGYADIGESMMTLKGDPNNTQDVEVFVFLIYQSGSNVNNQIYNYQQLYELTQYDLTSDLYHNSYLYSTGVYTYPLVNIGNKYHIAIEGVMQKNASYNLMSKTDGNGGNEFSFATNSTLGNQVADGNYGVVYHLTGENNSLSSVKIYANANQTVVYKAGISGKWQATSQTTTIDSSGNDLYLALPGGSSGNVAISTY